LHITLHYLISSSPSNESKTRVRGRRGTYDGAYVVESYLDCKTVVGVLLGLVLGDVGSCDVVDDCSFLVQDRAFRVV
jgi:hypothetical protein